MIVLERAPEEEAGGNTPFTAGAIRFAYNGVEDLKKINADLTKQKLKTLILEFIQKSSF